METNPSRRRLLQAGAWSAAWIALPSIGACARSRPLETPGASPNRKSKKLAELMARIHTTDAEIRSRSTNHLPMALCALAAIGGTDADLERCFADGFAVSNPFPKDALPADDRPWHARLGERAAFPRLVAHFRAELAKRPRADVLRDALKHLEPAMAAFAFHGIIRASYAVRIEDDEELAHALGFWASRAVPFGPVPGAGGDELDPARLVAELRKDEALAGDGGRGSVLGNMLAASRRPGFEAAVGALRIDDATVDRISNLAARAYLGNGDLTTLHGVTGAQAYRVFEPYFEDRTRARRALWQAVLAIYLGTGAPELAPLEAKEPPAWDVVFAAARERLDAHDVKLADAGREEERVLGGTLHRRAAAKRLRLG